MEFAGSALLSDFNSTGETYDEAGGTLSYFSARWSILGLLIALFALYSFRRSSIVSSTKRVSVSAPTARCDVEYQGSESEAVKSQLEGTWHLISYQLELKGPVRVTRKPFGEDTQGRLIYTSDGYMSVNMMQPGCEPFRATNPHGGTMQENSSAAAHYMAYSGRYETYEHQGQKIVSHRLDNSLYPNWLQTDQVRLCELDGDELVLRPRDMPTFLGMGVGGVLRWRRAPKAVDSNK